MSTTKTGREAETMVSAELKRRGHKILQLNWRTRYCEIDIVSTTKGTVYFTEVKYRKSDTFGDGFAAITASKLRQMEFAAEMWLVNNQFDGQAVMLAASVAGIPPKIDQIIEI